MSEIEVVQMRDEVTRERYEREIYVQVRSVWTAGRQCYEVVKRVGLQFCTVGQFANLPEAERAARMVNRRQVRSVSGSARRPR